MKNETDRKSKELSHKSSSKENNKVKSKPIIDNERATVLLGPTVSLKNARVLLSKDNLNKTIDKISRKKSSSKSKERMVTTVNHPDLDEDVVDVFADAATVSLHQAKNSSNPKSKEIIEYLFYDENGDRINSIPKFNGDVDHEIIVVTLVEENATLATPGDFPIDASKSAESTESTSIDKLTTNSTNDLQKSTKKPIILTTQATTTLKRKFIISVLCFTFELCIR